MKSLAMVSIVGPRFAFLRLKLQLLRETVGKWSIREPTVLPGLKGDLGLVATSQAAHHAISAPLPSHVDPAAGPVVVQYEVKLQNGLECGGAYIKLLTESAEGIQSEEFSDKSKPISTQC